MESTALFLDTLSNTYYAYYVNSQHTYKYMNLKALTTKVSFFATTWFVIRRALGVEYAYVKVRI